MFVMFRNFRFGIFLMVGALLLFASLPFCSAQQYNYAFDNITPNNSDLSGLTVTCFAQDKHGYLWVGTKDGLNRYDGFNFTVFNHHFGDPNSIPNNQINALFLDFQGILWIGTDGGLVRYNEELNRFETLEEIPSGIWAIAEDDTHSLWIGTGGSGLVHMRRQLGPDKKEIFNFYSTKADSLLPSALKSINVWSVCFDKFNQGWVGTQNGLYRFVPEKNPEGRLVFDPVRFDHRLNDHAIQDNNVWKVLSDNQGNIWLLSIDKMLDVITWQHLRDPIDKINIIHASPVLGKTISGAKRYYTLQQDRENNFWLGTNGYGILKYKLNIGSNDVALINPVLIQNDIANPRSLLDDNIQSFFLDNAGSIWVGVDKGISFYDPHREYFNTSPFNRLDSAMNHTIVTSLVEDDSILIIGTDERGIFLFNCKAPHQLINIPFIQGIRQKDGSTVKDAQTVYTMFFDHSGNLWISAPNSLFRISRAHLKKIYREWKKELVLLPEDLVYSRKNGSPFPLYSLKIFSILEDSQNRVWFGTGMGLNRYDPLTGFMERIPKNVESGEIVDDNIMQCLFMRDQDTLWEATQSGIWKLNVRNNWHEKFEAWNGQKIKINTWLRTDANTLWVGTNGTGLYRLDLQRGEIRSWSKQLHNNVIQAVMQDRQGNLWCSTSKGLSRINLSDSETVFNYNYKDGISSDAFNPNAALMTKKGILIFGNDNGLTAFYPDSIRINSFSPPIVINNFSVNGNSDFSDSSSNYRKLILNHEPIRLDFKHNSFSFEFSALNYTAPEKNQYRYWLEPFEKDSMTIRSRRFVSYTNLDQGTYKFHIRASNNSGLWNSKELVYTIVIEPRFTRTPLFFALVALCMVFILYIINRARNRNLNLRKEKEIALHTTQMKEVFLANMSHEIRTPLNAIIGMTRLLREKSPKPEQSKYLDAIMQSSDNLLVIINDILDISKIEAGKTELEKIPMNIRNVINGVYNTLRFKAEEKSLLLQTKISEDVPELVIGDPVRLSQVLINLCGNAIKFTEKGKVVVTCSVVEQEIQTAGKCLVNFKVTDSGIGIAPENFDKIFENFTQESSDTTRRFGGTGLGLAISKKLVEMHGGKINVESQLGKGTVFQFSILFEIVTESVLQVHHPVRPTELRESLQGISILIVEDNDFNRIVAQDTLEEEIKNVKIEVALNGIEAVQKVRDKRYDIVLMDVQMPEMNGYDATRMIRQLPNPMNGVKIIAMTASALKDEEDRCYDAGMDSFIAKPFDPEDLLLKMQEVLNK